MRCVRAQTATKRRRKSTMTPTSALRLTLGLSALWWLVFVLGTAWGHVHAALAPIAVAILVVGGRLAAGSSARVSARSFVIDLVVDLAIGLVVGGVSLVATHVLFPLVAAVFPALPLEIVRLRTFSPATPMAQGLTVLVVIAEEVLWRAMLLGALRGRGLSTASCVATTTTVYAVAQSGAGSLWLVVAAGGLGLLWTVLALSRGGRVVAPLVAHLVWTLGVLWLWPL
jgi:membrane protease YdiL (CAAX protease family)